jgi:hypothetical protein
LDVEKLLKRTRGPDYERRRAAGLRAKIGAEIALPLRPKYPGIQIKDINEAALEAIESLDPELRHPDTRHWDWRGFVSQFRACLTPMRVAIWNQTIVDGEQRNALHALAIGRTTSTRAAVKIEAMESFPFGNHPFCGDILGIVTRFSGAHGALLGAERLTFVNGHELSRS